MRRKYLLSAVTLSVLLASSACAAGSPAPVASSQAARLTGSGTGDGSTSRPEIGISQWNAAEAARKAKTKPAAAAKAEPTAKTKAATAAKAKSAEKAAAAAKATAASAAAAEKAAAAAAKKKAAAEKKAAAKKKAAGAAAKTRPAAGSAKRVVPVPVAPKTAPAPVRQGSTEQQGSAEQLVGSACGAAHTLVDTLKGSVTVSDPALPNTGTGTGTDAGTMGEFRCLD